MISTRKNLYIFTKLSKFFIIFHEWKFAGIVL